MMPYTHTITFDAHGPDGVIMYTVVFKIDDFSYKGPMGTWEDATTVTADVINWSPRGSVENLETSLYIKNIEYDWLKVIYNSFIRGRKVRRRFWNLLRQVKCAQKSAWAKELPMTTTLL